MAHIKKVFTSALLLILLLTLAHVVYAESSQSKPPQKLPIETVQSGDWTYRIISIYDMEEPTYYYEEIIH